MFSLIILVLFGLGMAYFATENTRLVSMAVAGNLLTGIPLYVLVAGSILLGIFISWLISLINSVSSTVAIHRKDSALEDADRTIQTLREEVRSLEVENANLREEHQRAHGEQPSFWRRLTHGFR